MEFPPIYSYKTSVDRKLRNRLMLYGCISVALLVASMYDVITGAIAWWVAVLAILVGLGIGFLYSRTRKIQWDEAGEKVVSRWDTFGVIALILYFVAAYGRDWLFAHWFSGVQLTSLTFSFLAGLLLGRFFGTRLSIYKALREKMPRY